MILMYGGNVSVVTEAIKGADTKNDLDHQQGKIIMDDILNNPDYNDEDEEDQQYNKSENMLQNLCTFSEGKQVLNDAQYEIEEEVG